MAQRIDRTREVSYALLWMGLLTHKERGEGSFATWVRKEAGELYPLLMPGHGPQEKREWTEGFLDYLSHQHNLHTALKIPYPEIRDMALKDTIRIRFGAAYAVASAQAPFPALPRMAERAWELVQDAMDESVGISRQMGSMRRALSLFYEPGQERVSPHVQAYLRQVRPLVEEWFEWLSEQEDDQAAQQQEQIRQELSRAHESLFLRRSEVEREVLSDLVASLSNPLYGDILSRLYEKSREEKGEEGPELLALRRDLRDFFLQLSHFRHPILPETEDGGKLVWLVGGGKE